MNEMLQDKRKDLDSERQKRILFRLVNELSQLSPDLYYRSTSEIAACLEKYIRRGAKLSTDDRALMARLGRRDIEVLLSLH